jgi:hypothetical protein
MASVQQCFDEPQLYDTAVSDLFTMSMYEELRSELANQGEEPSRLEQLDLIWATNLMDRMVIRDFLKDSSFGRKRLISMPDRMTSSIRTIDGKTLFRPSPITGNPAEMGCTAAWWPLWKAYMFQTKAKVRGETKQSVFAFLETIPRAKYPALSPDEEALSVPLQALCLTLFDAVLLHVLSRVAPQSCIVGTY